MTRPRRDESGAVLIITVISLVALLGITALAVDIGIAHSRRRTMQSGNDASALGAAQELTFQPPPELASCEGGNASGTQAAAAACARAIGAQNLTKFSIDWNSCPANDASNAGYNPIAGFDCISFSPSGTRIRVRIPRQTFPSLFGRIFGNSGTSTSTVAIAQVRAAGNAGLLPFMLFSGFGAGESCMDSGGTDTLPCTGPTTGNFYDIDFQQYGNADLNTNASSCSNGGQLSRLSDNIAMGADHIYSTHPTGIDPSVTDCVPNFKPNEVSAGTGNGSALDAGLIDNNGNNFSDGLPARLQRVPSGFSGWETAQVSKVDGIDNRPLWEFIPETTITGIPDSCQRATFDNLLSITPQAAQQAVMHAAIAQCIADYATSGSTTAVFTANTNVEPNLDVPDIVLSPRFSYVPQMWETSVICPGNSFQYCYHIKAFRPVFLQRVLGNTASALDFEPGPWNTGNVGQNHSAEAVTAWVFPAHMLPPPLDTPGVIGGNAFVQLVG